MNSLTLYHSLLLQLVASLPEKKLKDFSFEGVYVEQGGSSHGPYYLCFVTTSTKQELIDVPLLLQMDGCTVDVEMNIQLYMEQGDNLECSPSDILLFYYFQV